MTPPNITVEAGDPDKRGATFDGRGVNFSVFSAHATKIDICLYADDGKTETARVTLPNKTGDVWHGYIPNLKPGQLYGLRADGPFDPANGHRFNYNKLLLDPYAREITGDVKITPELEDPAKDSGPFTPKARVVEPFATPASPLLNTPWKDTIIYEAHPKGYTMQDQKVPADLRGKIEGLAHSTVTEYLNGKDGVGPGITAIELLPVQTKVNDGVLDKLGLKNYWGYNTIGFFSVTPEYLKTGQREEFRDMVDKMHKAGVEVILDVVYNHTGEGNHLGPTLSFRGLDNASYYKLDPKDKSLYADETGCGNTLNFNHPEVRRMVKDSLKYWAEDMGVDGFRFDLAPVLGSTPKGFSKDAPFFEELAADHVLSKVKLIAEPWGIASMQAGKFPNGWHEWNGGFRDDTRSFWLGDTHAGDKATRLLGSHPDYGITARPPATSVNMVTCHDGFTLEDLVSHSFKKNWSNGEYNNDGHNDNRSHNHGHEGATNDLAVLDLRDRQKRNMIASLMLSQGTPMILAGDEHGKSQGGNNNAYCQDNDTGWLNWDKTTDAGKKLTAWFKKAVAFRKAHPALSHDEYLHGHKKCAHGESDVKWISPDGREKSRPEDWHKEDPKCFGLLLNEEAVKGKAGGTRLLQIFNAKAVPVDFTLPKVACGKDWQRVLDTSAPEMEKDANPYPAKSAYTVPERSIVVFSLKP